jgi:hypothetical protein
MVLGDQRLLASSLPATILNQRWPPGAPARALSRTFSTASQETIRKALAMAVFLYQCPNTGKHVQGWIADDPAEDDPDDDADTYRSLACLACARVHLINPRTGKVLGGDD